jgi:hypothetical protein
VKLPGAYDIQRVLVLVLLLAAAAGVIGVDIRWVF